MTQREKILNEITRYAYLCDRLQTLMFETSQYILTLKKLNYQLAVDNHVEGYKDASWTQFRNQVNAHKTIVMLVSSMIFSILVWIMMLVSIVPVAFLFFLLPIITAVVLTQAIASDRQIQFINLPKETKSAEYKAIETTLLDSQISVNRLLSQYSAFYANAEISGLVTDPNKIVAPIIATNGQYSYPVMYTKIKAIGEYIDRGQADNLEEAQKLYSQKIAFRKSDRTVDHRKSGYA
jgi:hypothetical protein